MFSPMAGFILHIQQYKQVRIRLRVARSDARAIIAQWFSEEQESLWDPLGIGTFICLSPNGQAFAKRFSFPSGAATIRRKIGHSGNLHNLQTAGVQRTTPVPGT
jgi:hypothetical protein